MQTIDDYVVKTLLASSANGAETPFPATVPPDTNLLLDYFKAQVQSRHLDLGMRWLQSVGEGLLHDRIRRPRKQRCRGAGPPPHRPRAPALPLGRLLRWPRAPSQRRDRHRGRPARRHGSRRRPDLAAAGTKCSATRRSTSSRRPPPSPHTCHAPSAWRSRLGGRTTRQQAYPADAIVVCSFGDASANHSTAGALNAAGYSAHVGHPYRSFRLRRQRHRDQHPQPRRMDRASLRALPGLHYVRRTAADPSGLLAIAPSSSNAFGPSAPALLHLRPSGSWDTQAPTPRSATIRTRHPADYARDPILATAAALISTGAHRQHSALLRRGRDTVSTTAAGRRSGTPRRARHR